MKSEIFRFKKNSEYKLKLMPNYYTPSKMSVGIGNVQFMYLLLKGDKRVSILEIHSKSLFIKRIKSVMYSKQSKLDDTGELFNPFDLNSDKFIKIKTYMDSDEVESMEFYEAEPLYIKSDDYDEDIKRRKAVTKLYKGITSLDELSPEKLEILERDSKILQNLED